MLRAIIISPDRELATCLHRVLAQREDLSIVRVIDRYPDAEELSRLLGSHAPQLVFLNTFVPREATGVAALIEQLVPGIQLVAVGSSCHPEALVEIMLVGIREYVTAPFEDAALAGCLLRIKENLAKRPVVYEPSELLYSFLPAKPGVGATTLAVNSSLALARSGDLQALLLDFDLNSGMTRFMMKLASSHSILDAAQHAGAMDDNLWPQIVSKCGKLDVVHAGTLNPEIRIEHIQIHRLIDYVRSQYNVIAVDLSGNLEKYSMEIMHRSRHIFLVCTPELSSLHLAREKLQYLQRMDLSRRVRVLVNRYSKRSALRPAEIEELVGAPVMMTAPNDYARVAKAIEQGGAVEPNSELGKAYAQLAEHMAEKKAAAPHESRRKLAEYFNITPARFSFQRSK